MADKILVRISTLSKEKNISINKIYDILESCNIKFERNPNAKLSKKQINIIEDYLSKKNTNTESDDNSTETNVIDEDIIKNINSLDNIFEEEEEEERKEDNKLFKTFGFIDTTKLSIRQRPKFGKDKKKDQEKKNEKINKQKNTPEKIINTKKINPTNQEYKPTNLKKPENQNNKRQEEYNTQNSEKKTNTDQRNKFNKKKTFAQQNVKTIDDIKNQIKKYKQIKTEKINKQINKKKTEFEKNKTHVTVTDFTTIEILSSLINVKISDLIKKCKTYGLEITQTEKLDNEIIQILADDYGYNISFQTPITKTQKTEESKKNLKPRIPIVTVMGHVDHGKTTFLDYIRKTNITAKEKGGITQHLGAYKTKTSSGKEIVFLDTPGHESFSNMRSTSCDISDIVIMIIAADDGVKEQTKEALSHAKKNNTPIVFAFNKIDKEGANIEKIKSDLSSLNFITEDWGGRYQYQEISAKTGAGIDKLLEKVIIEAELLELKASFDGLANGTVIESSIDKGKGCINNVIVQDGKLKKGDIVIIGETFNKVKMLINDRGEIIKEAFPSDPVQIIGLNTTSISGEKFYTVEDEKEAKRIISERIIISRQQKANINKELIDDNREKLNIIIKSDVIGTAQAISNTLKNLSDEFINVNVIEFSVGSVTETDILLATTSKARIITFNTKTNANIIQLAKSKNVQIAEYNIIYDIVDYVTGVIKKMKNKNKIEKYVGKAKIQATFDISKVGKIAGCIVLEGPIFKKNNIKIIRDENIIFKGEIKTIKHKKAEIESVKALDECGICVKNFEDFKIGDIIEFFNLVDNE